MLSDWSRVTCFFYFQGGVSWAASVLRTDPAHPLTTAGYDLDDLYVNDLSVYDLSVLRVEFLESGGDGRGAKCPHFFGVKQSVNSKK